MASAANPHGGLGLTPLAFVKYTGQGPGVVLIELARPDTENMIDQPMIDDLVAAIKWAENDVNVGCVVLAGLRRGPFSVGLDHAKYCNLTTAKAHELSWLKDLSDAVAGMKKPIIAAVEGFATGTAFELAMMCDIIIAGEGTKFSLPEITFGTMPGAGGTQRLTRTLGKHRAMELILVGETISAKELLKRGIVNVMVDKNGAIIAAVDMAKTIITRSGPLVQLAKQAVLNAENTHLDTGIKMERALYYSTFSLHDPSKVLPDPASLSTVPQPYSGPSH